MTTPDDPAQPGDADAFAERVLGDALGAYELLSIYVGERMGWYVAIADGPVTSTELAARTSADERYTREWLELQAAYGVLSASADRDPLTRTYALPAGPREVLTDEHSLAYLAGLPRIVAASAKQLPALLDAYRSGGGVGWADLGDDAYQAQAALNRPLFEQRLGPVLAGIRPVHAVLSRPGARVLDLGCGAGWSTLALARAYPAADVRGWDVDTASIALARHNAAEAGQDVRFEVAAGEDLASAAPLDVVFLFECLHDLPRPVEVLGAVRTALAEDGVVVVMDEAVAEEFSAPADEVDRLMYGFSLFTCLPDAMASRPSAATGTVMRPATVDAYAREAGFGRVEVLPAEDVGFFRFYALRT